MESIMAFVSAAHPSIIRRLGFGVWAALPGEYTQAYRIPVSPFKEIAPDSDGHILSDKCSSDSTNPGTVIIQSLFVSDASVNS